jgi:uncharacterized membrane protein
MARTPRVLLKKEQTEMATLTVFRFETEGGALQAVGLIERLQKQALIQLHDAATVTWPIGSKKPKTNHLSQMTGRGAVDGAFWGMLFGMIFFVPFFGMAIGAAMGALTAKFRDYGIDDDFIKSIRERVTEGTSAVFLLTSGAVKDKVIDAAKSLPRFELITSNLSDDQEAALRAAFSGELKAAAPGAGV